MNLNSHEICREWKTHDATSYIFPHKWGSSNIFSIGLSILAKLLWAFTKSLFTCVPKRVIIHLNSYGGNNYEIHTRSLTKMQSTKIIEIMSWAHIERHTMESFQWKLTVSSMVIMKNCQWWLLFLLLEEYYSWFHNVEIVARTWRGKSRIGYMKLVLGLTLITGPGVFFDPEGT